MSTIVQASAKSMAVRYAIALMLTLGLALLVVMVQGAQAQEEVVIEDAASTSFSVSEVTLANNGDFATITVNATGVPAGVTGLQLNIQHPTTLTVTVPACAGIFSGGSAFSFPTDGGTLLGCALLSGTVSGADGDVMSFRLTRASSFSASQTVSFGLGDPCVNEFATYYGEPSPGSTVCESFPDEIRHGPGTVNTLTVKASDNEPPVADDDSYSTDEDTTLSVAAPGVLDGDTDPDGDPLTAALVSDVAHGSLTLNPDGSFDYTPDANYNGPDSFTYVANDGVADSNTATVSITVNPVNDAPVADNDNYGTAEDTPLTVAAPGVLANDTDVDGDALTAILVSDVSNGSLTLGASGSFTYTPDGGFNGVDSFTYKANDGAADSNTATVSIDVGAVNDAPVANDDFYSTGEGATLTVSAPGVLINDTDADGDPLTAIQVSSPPNGSLVFNADGSFTYTPDGGFSGSDSFTYMANDGALDSNVATVSIEVSAAPTTDIEFLVHLQVQTATGQEAFMVEGWQGDTLMFTRPATAAAVDQFDYTLSLADVPQGTFTVKVITDRHNGFSNTLPNIVPGVVVGPSGVTPDDLGTLREGDVVPNSDWIINALDLSRLLASLDPATFPAGNPALYSSWVDLDQDGVVDSSDYNLLVNNYRCHASSSGTVCP